jgi:hypothetical protein
LYTAVETLPIFQNVASTLVFVWDRREMSSQLDLEKVRSEREGDVPFSDQNNLPVSFPKVTGVWRGRALAGVLRQSDQSEKN